MSQSQDTPEDDYSTESPELSQPVGKDTGIRLSPSKAIDRIAYRIFGTYFKQREDKYASTRKKLQQARMGEVGYDMYLSRVVFYSLVIGLLGAGVGILITYLLFTLGVFSEYTLGVTVPPSVATFIENNKILLSGVLLTVLISGFVSVVTGATLYYVPHFYAGERKRSINTTLPHAVTFMYALSRGGMNIVEVIEAIANADDAYGEVSNEFKMILNDMEYFGSDLRLALRNASETTPSDSMEDFLDDLLGIVDSGGDITPFLLQKSEQYLERARQEQKGFLDTLALIAESYVTAFVAGPLFIIIITVIMSVLGGASLTQIYAIVYLVIPVGSLGFAFIIDILSTGGEQSSKTLKTEIEEFDVENWADIETEDGGKLSDDPRYKSLRRAKKMENIKSLLRNPFASVKEEPLLSLVVTVPVAAALFAGFVFAGVSTATVSAFKSRPIWNTATLFVIPAMTLTVPVSFFHELKMRRRRKVLRELPDTLKKLAGANETGMTLTESLRMVYETSTGVLANEIEMVYTEIEWDADLNDSFIRFANRMKIPRLSRTIKLITKANESSGDIGDVLEVAARDVESAYKLDRERFQNMIIYVVIIIISFLVFLFVVVILENTFLTNIAESTSGAEGLSQAGGGALSFEEIPLDTYRMVLFHSAIIQAFSSGLLAGRMGENSMYSGLKYSIILTLIALGVFIFL
ncbi:MAG: type II secretion system F family protein [Halobacteria archaeon]|nr:type II secretion system F family protein [Halobacteria archaeon]